MKLSKQLIKKVIRKGTKAAYNEGLNAISEKVEDFVDLMNHVKSQMDQVLETNKQDTIHMIKNLTKWIALKEVDNADVH
jgi:hypothetical protein